VIRPNAAAAGDLDEVTRELILLPNGSTE
jgi:hypothetical protein